MIFVSNCLVLSRFRIIFFICNKTTHSNGYKANLVTSSSSFCCVDSVIKAISVSTFLILNFSTLVISIFVIASAFDLKLAFNIQAK